MESVDLYQLFQQGEKFINMNARPHIYLEQFHSTPPILGHLYAVYAVALVCNTDGLFDGVFASQVGLMMPEAIQGFQHLEMPKTANVLSRAASKLGSPYPRVFGVRQKRLKNLLKQIDNETVQAKFKWTEQNITEDLTGFETLRAILVFEHEEDEYFDFVQSENGGLEQAAQIYAKDFLQNQSYQ
jgi:hypothetical protein